jgi:hypothetical protein
MQSNENILEREKMSIERALCIYAFMHLLRRFKIIFIVFQKALKLRLVQIFRRKRNYFVQINFTEKNYLFTTANGNSLRRGADVSETFPLSPSMRGLGGGKTIIVPKVDSRIHSSRKLILSGDRR